MIPYLLLLAFVFWLSLKIEKDRAVNAHYARSLKWVLILILTSFVGFRYGVGADYFSYVQDYRRWRLLSFSEILTGKEPLIRLMAKLSYSFSSSAVPFFWIIAFVYIVPSICTIYRYAEKFTLAILLFILCGSYLDCCNACRQCMAVGIVFANYDNLRQQKLVKYLIVTLIASLLHSSAITMLPLYFVFSPKANLKKQCLWMVGTMALLFFSFSSLMSTTSDILGKQLDGTVKYFSTSVSILRVLVFLAPCLLLFFLKHKERQLPSFAVFLLFNAVMALVTCRSAYLMRICMYTNIFTCLAIPEAMRALRLSSESVRGIQAVMLLLYLFYWLYGVLNSAGLYPYQCVFMT